MGEVVAQLKAGTPQARNIRLTPDEIIDAVTGVAVIELKPELGGDRIDLHRLSDPNSGALTLMAFQDSDPSAQVDVVATVARREGWRIEQLHESDISPEAVAVFVNHFREHELGGPNFSDMPVERSSDGRLRPAR
jgi:hypothetical protein